MELIKALEIAIPFLFRVMPPSQRDYWRKICDNTELRNPEVANFLRPLMEKAWARGDIEAAQKERAEDSEADAQRAMIRQSVQRKEDS